MKPIFKRSILSIGLVTTILLSFLLGNTQTALANTPEIVILYTNDVHCGVDDNIGYAGLTLLKTQMLEQTPYVTLVDAGDATQGASIGTLSDGGYLIDIMNKVSYDIAIPGNHEFDYGMERFLELSKKLNCGYISSNFQDLKTGSLVFAPYKIMTYGSVKVAFVGVTTPESFTKSTPTYFQDENGVYQYGFYEDATGEKLYTQIQSNVDAARSEGADYVILVGHLGEHSVTPHWSSDSIVKNTTGIDACIDGHSHETVPSDIVMNKDGQNVLITQTGTKLKNIGRLTIKPDGTITTELISKVSASDTSSETYTVEKGDTLARIAKKKLGSYNRYLEIYNVNRDKLSTPDLLTIGMRLSIPSKSSVNKSGNAIDYDTDQFIKSIQAQYQETLKTVLAHTDYELTINQPETEVRAVRNAETNLGDLTADAYRYVLDADIGFANGGGIRSSIKAGDITYHDTLAVFPYGSMGCVASVSGQVIKDTLEHAYQNFPEESGAFLQVSGITLTIDSSIPSSVQTDDKRAFVKVAGPYRVTDIKVNNEPLDLHKMYRVASLNYILKSGGDGFSMYQGAEIIKDEVISDVDLLSAYMKQNLGGNVGAAYQNPKGQGRITIR